jgi:hypothetical protein
VKDAGPGLSCARICREIASTLWVEEAGGGDPFGPRPQPSPMTRRAALAVGLRVAILVCPNEVVAEVRLFERLPVRAAHVARHHEQVRCVLGELLLALHVQRVRERVPHLLVDPDDVLLGAHEEDGRARDSGEVDRSRERDRDPRLDVEPIESVEDVDVRAIGRMRCAIRLRQVDAQSGDLRVVVDAVEVARERLSRLRSGEGTSRKQERKRHGGNERAHGDLLLSARWGAAATVLLTDSACQRNFGRVRAG